MASFLFPPYDEEERKDPAVPFVLMDSVPQVQPMDEGWRLWQSYKENFPKFFAINNLESIFYKPFTIYERLDDHEIPELLRSNIRNKKIMDIRKCLQQEQSPYRRCSLHENKGWFKPIDYIMSMLIWQNMEMNLNQNVPEKNRLETYFDAYMEAGCRYIQSQWTSAFFTSMLNTTPFPFLSCDIQSHIDKKAETIWPLLENEQRSMDEVVKISTLHVRLNGVILSLLCLSPQRINKAAKRLWETKLDYKLVNRDINSLGIDSNFETVFSLIFPTPYKEKILNIIKPKKISFTYYTPMQGRLRNCTYPALDSEIRGSPYSCEQFQEDRQRNAQEDVVILDSSVSCAQREKEVLTQEEIMYVNHQLCSMDYLLPDRRLAALNLLLCNLSLFFPNRFDVIIKNHLKLVRSLALYHFNWDDEIIYPKGTPLWN